MNRSTLLFSLFIPLTVLDPRAFGCTNKITNKITDKITHKITQGGESGRAPLIATPFYTSAFAATEVAPSATLDPTQVLPEEIIVLLPLEDLSRRRGR